MEVYGALLLTVAICSHHFTAMGAASIMPDPRIAVSETAIPTGWLAVAVALASLAILLLACCGLALDIRDRRRLEQEKDRMRGLANAAAEGLVVCDGEIIETANRSFADLTGVPEELVAGLLLSSFLPDETLRTRLLGHSGEVIETVLRQAVGGTIPVELVARPVTFANQPRTAIAVRDIRARKKAEADLRHLAQHDSLTGLPNRRSFNSTLDREIAIAAANGDYLALLCIDLDRFKEVNDLFGHATGDAMLQSVARCTARVLGEDQMLARLGGDEFAVIAPGLPDPAAAGRIAESILDAFRAENQNGGDGGLVSGSIGIAIYPNDAVDRESLMSYADTALYRAKGEGRGTYRFFETAMGAEVKERRRIEHDLLHAISRGQLRLAYQPQRQLVTGEVIGFEALLRWQHAERGAISPEIFIPIAEESGLILQIGEWVLRTACREAASWESPLVVAVNVSAVQLHSAQFSQLLHEILLQTGLAPQRLELEITETALVRDKNRALATLRQLKNLGVRIAMDDFGTGYSSLSNLRAFPFDKIKIDGSFIRSVDSNEEAATIVRAVLGLGRGLGLPVLAEGVETAGELAFLAAESCGEGQGYFLGRPGPIEAYHELTGNGGPDRREKPAAAALSQAS